MSLTHSTPVEDHREQWGLWVKREDLCCPPPGPPFSKMRGVMAHVADRPEKVIGVLDTSHSQAGHAVSYACRELGKTCVNFFPVRKADRLEGGWPKSLAPQQRAALDLGANMVPLQAGRSAILFHQAKKALPEFAWDEPTYMMPNALKLPEMIEETRREARATFAARRYDTVLIACSSATIGAGVLAGWMDARVAGEAEQPYPPHFIFHMGYDRPVRAVRDYIARMSGVVDTGSEVIVEGYGYADKARPGPTPSWPCNEFYDLKAFRWWARMDHDRRQALYPGDTLLWNIG